MRNIPQVLFLVFPLNIPCHMLHNIECASREPLSGADAFDLDISDDTWDNGRPYFFAHVTCCFTSYHTIESVSQVTYADARENDSSGQSLDSVFCFLFFFDISTLVLYLTLPTLRELPYMSCVAPTL